MTRLRLLFINRVQKEGIDFNDNNQNLKHNRARSSSSVKFGLSLFARVLWIFPGQTHNKYIMLILDNIIICLPTIR